MAWLCEDCEIRRRPAGPGPLPTSNHREPAVAAEESDEAVREDLAEGPPAGWRCPARRGLGGTASTAHRAARRARDRGDGVRGAAPRPGVHPALDRPADPALPGRRDTAQAAA